MGLSVLFTGKHLCLQVASLLSCCGWRSHQGGRQHLLRGCARELTGCSQGLGVLFQIFNNKDSSAALSNQTECAPTNSPWEKVLSTFFSFENLP